MRKVKKEDTPTGPKTPPRLLASYKIYIFNQIYEIGTLELAQPVPGERSLENSVIFDESV